MIGHFPAPAANGTTPRDIFRAPPAVQVQVTRIMDPFDALMEANGSDVLAAELCGCQTVAEFYRKLEAADPEKFHRGMQARLAVSLTQMLCTVQGRIIDRLNVIEVDDVTGEGPVSDKTLVELLTKTLPALSGMLTLPGVSKAATPADGLKALQEFVSALPVGLTDKLIEHLPSE